MLVRAAHLLAVVDLIAVVLGALEVPERAGGAPSVLDGTRVLEVGELGLGGHVGKTLVVLDAVGVHGVLGESGDGGPREDGGNLHEHHHA